MITLRRYFVAGLLVWIPLGITLWVLSLLVGLMDQSLLLVPANLRSEALFGFHVPGMGIILTLAIVLSEEHFDAALLAIANFVDLKSPYFLGHAHAVSELAAEAVRKHIAVGVDSLMAGLKPYFAQFRKNRHTFARQ